MSSPSDKNPIDTGTLQPPEETDGLPSTSTFGADLSEIIARMDSADRVQAFDIIPHVTDNENDTNQEGHQRYENPILLGQGGAGEVYRVWDNTLQRPVAYKTLRPELTKNPRMVERFIREAQVVARLEHPSIVPIHDLGKTPDGKWFIIMKEIRGRTLREIVSRLHQTRTNGQFTPTKDGWTLRRTVDAFRHVCEAMSLAHTKGVLHRDLKPDNVMVGDFGEVLVVDWGLGKILHESPPTEEGPPEQDPDAKKTPHRSNASSTDQGSGSPAKRPSLDESGSNNSHPTEFGTVIGTPSYMPPEQARGAHDEMGPWSDVWSLGAILYAILYGRSPYAGNPKEIIQQVITAPPQPCDEFPTPVELVEIWQKAMRLNPTERYQSAGKLADDINAWIAGSKAREGALRLVHQAHEKLPQLRQTQAKSARVREQARAAVISLRPPDSLTDKEAAWALEDEARRLQEMVQQQYIAITNQARLALTQAPGLTEAREILAQLYRQRAESAEAARDQKAAREFRALLAEHDDGRHADYLRSDGRLFLHTEPPGATIEIFQYQDRSRRRSPISYAKSGPTPIDGLRLPVGDYLLEISHPHRGPIRYPIRIGRSQPWKMIPPGEKHIAPVVLPHRMGMRDDEKLVPAGWFSYGGDPAAVGPMPRQRIWVADFAIAASPVTHEQYLHYLNDLIANQRENEALARVPRFPARSGRVEDPIYEFARTKKGGCWNLPKQARDLTLHPDAPVVLVTWLDAQCYCQWHAKKTQLPWRLPGEFEREKAARGVDGRQFPWGEFADPAFHCEENSVLTGSGAPPANQFHIDESPYGVMGLAGGVQEWCADIFSPEGPPRKGSKAITPQPPEKQLEVQAHAARRAVRSGAWNLPSRYGRTASRTAAPPLRRSSNLGFRICRSGPFSSALSFSDED